MATREEAERAMAQLNAELKANQTAINAALKGEPPETARLINTDKTGTVIQGERGGGIRNVRVKWPDGADTWHRVVHQQKNLTIVLPEGAT